MPLFVCDECQTIENTATGHYWMRDESCFADESKKGKALCSACTPPMYRDGSSVEYSGWHGKFPREIATAELLKKYGNLVIYNTTVPTAPLF